MNRRTSSLRPAPALLAAALALGTPARALTLTAEDQRTVEQGLDALYRSDFDGAERVFRGAMDQKPGYAPFSLGAAAVAWWRLENSFALPGDPEEAAFRAAVAQAMKDAKRAARGPSKAEACFCLGAAYGLRGRWEASQRRWLAAYFDGLRAYHEERKAVKLDPELYDAYLGLGAFDYYLATLSRFVRVLAFAAHAGRDKGLDELRLAADKGRFGATAAKLVLVGIYWTYEKNPREAWRILDEVHARYPESPFVDSLRLVGLYHLRDAAGLKKEARAFLDKAEAGEGSFRPSDRPAGRYFLGLGEQLSGAYDQAVAEYEAALKEVPPRHRQRSLLRLFIGEALDLSGRREEAMKSYRQALDEPPFWGVQRYARFLLKRPFRPEDDPLPGRRDALE